MSEVRSFKQSKFMTGAQRLESAVLRFSARTKVVANEHGLCWLWSGPLGRKGYVRFRTEDGTKASIHRWAYELMVGPIPEGLTIDHLCRNTNCANPDHLEPVTDLENIARGTQGKYQRDKTHCRNGHEFSPENTYVNPEGHRACIECRRAVGRINDAKRRAKRK